MSSVTQLERTIDKILDQTHSAITSGIESASGEAQRALDDAVPSLNMEYDKIISDGKKEVDKISRQIVGSADLEIRNKQLLVLEEAVDRVFEQALGRISDTDRNGPEYSELLRSLLAESVAALGTREVTVSTSERDRDAVQSIVSSEYPDSEVAAEPIGCLGGVRIRSKDGAMTFDNTLDARIERIKPLIRKEIASKFGVGSS